jgi:hypothetical protein
MLDRYFGNGGVVQIGTSTGSYIGLCTGYPGDAGSAANEVNFGSRPQITILEWSAPSGGSIGLNTTVSWTATSPQTLSHWLLGDTNTVSSSHDFGASLGITVGVSTSDEIRFGPNDVQVSITDLFTDYYSSHALNMLLTNASTAPETVYYYALSTTTPNEDGTNFTEPTGGNYARVSKTRGGPFGTAVSGSPSTITNSNDEIRWSQATGSWGTVTYWGAFDAYSGGNLLLFGALSTGLLIGAGIEPLFDYNDFVITME